MSDRRRCLLDPPAAGRGIGERVRALRVGPGTDEHSEMGPLVTATHRDKVASYLDGGVAEGATLAVDGRMHPVIGGDTHIYGTEGIHFYTRGKAVTSRWLDPSHGGVPGQLGSQPGPGLAFPTNK